MWAPLLWSEGCVYRHSLCSLSSTSSVWSHPPAFRGTAVWNSLASCCIGQRHLCWVMDALMVIGWIRVAEVVFHFTMFLTSLLGCRSWEIWKLRLLWATLLQNAFPSLGRIIKQCLELMFSKCQSDLRTKGLYELYPTNSEKVNLVIFQAFRNC